eukprot:2360916-Rhodomonas_salina.1
MDAVLVFTAALERFLDATPRVMHTQPLYPSGMQTLTWCCLWKRCCYLWRACCSSVCACVWPCLLKGVCVCVCGVCVCVCGRAESAAAGDGLLRPADWQEARGQGRR